MRRGGISRGSHLKEIRNSILVIYLSEREIAMSENSCKCQGCFKVFASKFSRDRHVRSGVCRKVDVASSRTCVHCSKVFATNASKCRHVANNVCGWRKLEVPSAHPRTLECHRCFKVFASNNSRCRHARADICVARACECANASKELHDCRACGASFAQRRYLQRHRARCKGVGSLECAVCHRVFKTRQSKSNHMRRGACLRQTGARNFGEEDFEHITQAEDYFARIRGFMKLGKYAVPELLELMFFDERHPENLTLRKRRRNDKYVEVRVNGVWMRRLIMDVFGVILKRMETIHSAYFSHMRSMLLDMKADANYRSAIYPIRVYAHAMLWYGWRCDEISQLTLLNFPDDEQEERRRWREMSSICMEKIYEKTKASRRVANE